MTDAMPPDPALHLTDHDTVNAAVRTWLEVAVIGLNLCPFAKAVHVHQQIRYRVSDATASEHLIDDLKQELLFLAECDSSLVDTTLLTLPRMLSDFLDYNDFLDSADRLLSELNLDGVLQIASFHPHYQFAGSHPDDIDNFTNRSPYPILHLLRESSVDRAVAAFPNADAIVERNLETLRRLGHAGWTALDLPSAPIQK